MIFSVKQFWNNFKECPRSPWSAVDIIISSTQPVTRYQSTQSKWRITGALIASRIPHWSLLSFPSRTFPVRILHIFIKLLHNLLCWRIVSPRGLSLSSYLLFCKNFYQPCSSLLDFHVTPVVGSVTGYLAIQIWSEACGSVFGASPVPCFY